LPRHGPLLRWGSLLYATYFVTSFPIYYFLDERPGRPWSLLTVCGAALSASMLTLHLLDFATHLVGRLCGRRIPLREEVDLTGSSAAAAWPVPYAAGSGPESRRRGPGHWSRRAREVGGR